VSQADRVCLLIESASDEIKASQAKFEREMSEERDGLEPGG